MGTVAWKDHTLTSGSHDKTILNHDDIHEICGLKWLNTGDILASGGNDNLVCIWDALKMSSSLKAFAWCPYQFEVLASGGVTSDGCIKIWNIQRRTCINSIDTKAQASYCALFKVCGLGWNKHCEEILGSHGFSTAEHQNGPRLWRYLSMSTVGEFMRHSSRLLHLSQACQNRLKIWFNCNKLRQMKPCASGSYLAHRPLMAQGFQIWTTNCL
ncbi:WD40 repeat [Dillenia turbinata]|uniref:WD40 repeat n=1 Tax=Dillenia turbinata TaxID=194707 RepID=A0AAN8VJV8_9MAGN